MASGNNVTVTGKLGPGFTATSQVFSNVTNLSYDFSAQTLRIAQGSVITTFDLYGIATVTYSVASHIATVVAST